MKRGIEFSASSRANHSSRAQLRGCGTVYIKQDLHTQGCTDKHKCFHGMDAGEENNNQAGQKPGMTLLASTCASLCQTRDRFGTVSVLVLFSMETLQTNCFPDNMDAFLLECHCFFFLKYYTLTAH